MSGAIPGMSDVALSDSLVVHPRVLQQGLLPAASRARLLATLPTLVPFAGSYAGALLAVDWDHRLPSKQLLLRLLTFRSSATLAIGRAALGLRAAEIAAKNRFPEFDLPDFGDLHADECYEADLAMNGEVSRPRLTSGWRRDVDEADGERAVDTVRASEEFALLDRVSRSPHLGDLETVGWVPPCESGLEGWTLDVWYPLAFENRVGSGRSLLVDLGPHTATPRVVAVRDFTIKA